jgi:hypothetical protein
LWSDDFSQCRHDFWLRSTSSQASSSFIHALEVSLLQQRRKQKCTQSANHLPRFLTHRYQEKEKPRCSAVVIFAVRIGSEGGEASSCAFFECLAE